MRKLDVPADDPVEVYKTCAAAVSNDALRQTYIANEPQIGLAKTALDAASATASWANLPRVPVGNPQAVIAGTLTKQALVELYSTYMVAAKGASRKIYDDILVAAGGLCPFCGGLGQVRTLDHYLPKSNFPIYSIFPANLVPCCRDCNTGKNSSFGNAIHEQTLHPYLDDDKFFETRWVSASVAWTNPVSLDFVCSPPPEWSVSDKLRVQQHFNSYNVGYRFSVQAGAELGRVVDLRSNSLKCLTPGDFRAYLLENANSSGFDLNGWSRTMYQALSDTAWFCEVDFTDPDWHL